MIWLARIFTWWNGQTINTALHTSLFGKFAGKDEFGNRYYRTRKIDKALGFGRRWVIYAGESEGSMTPPGWYGWLHHTARPWPPMRGLRRPAITRPGRRKAEVGSG
jgi:NADH:ubiquinone oxidoreductase subunit